MRGHQLSPTWQNSWTSYTQWVLGVTARTCAWTLSVVQVQTGERKWNGKCNRMCVSWVKRERRAKKLEGEINEWTFSKMKQNRVEFSEQFAVLLRKLGLGHMTFDAGMWLIDCLQFWYVLKKFKKPWCHHASNKRNNMYHKFCIRTSCFRE